jgi:RHS repeat-associated protein
LGARRSPDGHSADPASFQPLPGHREFTGHETIPGVGLVNMNGRVYDPVIGRFLSPDPNVQFAADLQSYNRYSYVLNNPLRYTDPTGYFLDSAARCSGCCSPSPQPQFAQSQLTAHAL